MKISIIIPAHNNEHDVKRCVESIMSQDYSDIEIIIIENASVDSTYEVCKKIKDNRIKLIHTDVGGVSHARNIGLSEAEGDIISFCDADDYLEDNCLSNVIEKIYDHQADILVSQYNRIDRNGIKHHVSNTKSSKVQNADKFLNDVYLNDAVMGAMWNKFFRRELIENIRFDEDVDLCEDVLFLSKLLSSNSNAIVSLVDLTTYNYCDNVNSVTANIEKGFDGERNIYIKTLEKIEESCKLTNENLNSLNAEKVKLSLNTLWEIKQMKNTEMMYRRRENAIKCIEKYRKQYLKSSYIPYKKKLRFLIFLVTGK